MNKKYLLITVCGVAAVGVIVSVIQYKNVREKTVAMEQEAEEFKKYNDQLNAIKQQIESKKGTEEDFIYTERQKLNRINNTFSRIV